MAAWRRGPKRLLLALESLDDVAALKAAKIAQKVLRLVEQHEEPDAALRAKLKQALQDCKRASKQADI